MSHHVIDLTFNMDISWHGQEHIQAQGINGQCYPFQHAIDLSSHFSF